MSDMSHSRWDVSLYVTCLISTRVESHMNSYELQCAAMLLRMRHVPFISTRVDMSHVTCLRMSGMSHSKWHVSFYVTCLISTRVDYSVL